MPRTTQPLFTRRAYWFCQAGGWAIWATANVVAYVAAVKKEDAVRSAWVLAFLPLLGLAATHLLRYVFRRDNWQVRSIGSLAWRIVWQSAAAAVASVAVHISFAFFCANAVKRNELKPVTFLIVFVMWTSLFVLWLTIYAGVHIYARSRQLELMRLQAEAAATEAELRALKMQVNPHFLFNCLNSIRALIIEGPELAQEAVTRLSTLLRYSLQSDRRATVRLDEEMEAVADYLKLEQIRFEQRLRATVHVSDEARAVEIPPMLVQTLVENAIKHGIAKLPEGGEVTVEATRERGGLQIRVENPGQLEARGEGTGLGLENARKRLQLLFGDTASLRLTAQDGAVRAEVWIPR